MTDLSPKLQIYHDLLLAFEQRDLGEDIDYEHDLPDSIEQLWLLRAATIGFGQALKLVRDRVETAIAQELGVGGVARSGPDFVRYARPSSQVLLDDVLIPWMVENLTVEEVLRVLPKVSKVRVTGLEAVAAKHGIPKDLLEGTFFVKKWGDPKLTSMPADSERAPKYAAEMEPGEIRRKDDPT